MPWRLLRFGLSKSHPEPRMFTAHDKLKPSYDVVIIGGGGHGLSSAYYLARDHGITNVAVLEKGYIGGGNTGRNTTIIRSNYLTPEGVKFYDKSVQLWQDLSPSSTSTSSTRRAATSRWPTPTPRCAPCAGAQR